MNEVNVLLLAYVTSFYVTLYLSLFVHELGHALVGKWIGLEITSFGIGLAKPLVVFKCRGTIVYLCLKNAHFGLTFYLSQLTLTKSREVLFYLGGALFNLFLSLIGLLCWLTVPWWHPFWITLGAVNLLLLALNLLPSKALTNATGLDSDGLTILRILRRQHRRQTGLDSILQFHNLRGLLQAIRDRRMEAYCVHRAANTWRFLGLENWANELSQGYSDPFPMAEMFALAEQARKDCESGNLEAAESRLNEAKNLAAAKGEPVAETVIVFLKARLAFAKDQHEEAWNLLNDWGKQAWMSERPPARALWYTSLVQLPSDALTNEMLINWDQEYSSLQASHIFLTTNWRFYQKITELYVARGLTEQAVAASCNAMNAAVEIAKLLPTSEDRLRFGEHVAPFQKEVVHFLNGQENTDVPNEISTSFRSADEQRFAELQNEEAKLEKKYLQDWKMVRWGLALTGVNLLTCFCAVWIIRIQMSSREVNTPLGGWLVVLTLLLAMFLVGAVFYLALYFLSRQANSHRKETPGAMLIALGAIPWITFVGLMVFYALVFWI